MHVTIAQSSRRARTGPTFYGGEVFDTIANLRPQGKCGLRISVLREPGTKGDLIFD